MTVELSASSLSRRCSSSRARLARVGSAGALSGAGGAEGALPLHLQGDLGWLVTVDLMRSVSSEFEGGSFQTETA